LSRAREPLIESRSPGFSFRSKYSTWALESDVARTSISTQDSFAQPPHDLPLLNGRDGQRREQAQTYQFPTPPYTPARFTTLIFRDHRPFASTKVLPDHNEPADVHGKSLDATAVT